MTETWIDRFKKLPIALALKELNCPDAIKHFGAKDCRERRRILRYVIDTLRQFSPSGAWMDNVELYGEQFPNIWKMALARAETRYGENGKLSRRFTPKCAVGLEDEIDLLAIRDAHNGTKHYPPSPSALAIGNSGRCKSRPRNAWAINLRF